MVGLHVVYYQVVECTALQSGLDILEELLADSEVGGVKQGGFLVKQHIAVIRHPTRDGVDILEQGGAAVADTDINQIVVNWLNVMHDE